MKLIQLGIIVNTKGIAGELTIINVPKNIFMPVGCPVFIGYSKNFVDKYILSDDFYGQVGRCSLFLEGVESINGAIPLKEKAVFADEEEILKHNNNYIFTEDILGCSVFDIDKDAIIGEIIDVWEMPANNVWLVKTEEGDIPLPVIDDVIKECDFKTKTIKVKMLDGLEEIIIKK